MDSEQIETILNNTSIFGLFDEQTIIEMIEDYGIISCENNRIANDLLLFINNYENAFERSNLERHFTASCWIITDDNKRALITHHKKLGLKLQLGGHCDGDRNLLRVALREAMEEGGIKIEWFLPSIFDIDIHTIPTNKGVIEHLHYDVRFLFQVPSNSNFTVSEESTNLEWITKDYDDSECTIGFQRLFKKWKDLDFDSCPFIGV